MAGTIPVYESKRGVDIQLVPKMSNEGAMRTARAGAQLTGAADNAIETMQRLQDTQEQNAAQVYATQELSKLSYQADEDPDFKNSDRYQAEVNRIGADAEKNINGEFAKKEFLARFNIASESTMSSIKTKFRTRLLSATQADMISAIEANKQTYLNATSPQERMASEALMRQTITDNVNGHAITSEEGAKLWIKVQDDLKQSEFYNDAIDMPLEEVKSRLKSGYYRFEDNKANIAAMEFVYRARNQMEKEIKIKGIADASTLAISVLDARGDVVKQRDALKNLDASIGEGAVPPELGVAIKAMAGITTVKGTKAMRKSMDSEYLAFRDVLKNIDHGDSDAIGQVVLSAIKTASEKNITEKQLYGLTTVLKLAVKMNEDPSNTKWGQFKAAIGTIPLEGVLGASRDYADRMFESFANRMVEGKTSIEDALAKSSAEASKATYPEANDMAEIGKEYTYKGMVVKCIGNDKNTGKPRYVFSRK